MVENDAYSAFLRRAIRAAGRRVGNGDVDGLADLLGVTRQAAQQRWGCSSGEVR